ncbi:efflux RND transporter periplasmic adaptor subunit [Cohnella zeiphila]|uniref:Efflux RND transporter periplasmic adaptor subunit n=1 Tax=Cohnella zeiphila TaxID=2761120 RepID=A0A7X0SHV6_9BACL|nr:efflux RND transporter periplasmic adaptor subunit [Cohnella zeiphila]MBB6730249.1 efflux RND transporter periplasmic adaptor subunit [Cohnella zeiphila]
MKRKTALRWALGLFFGGLLVLTFLSNTIQSLSLPKVAVEKPTVGSLDLSISEDGFLQPAYTAPLVPLGNWTVTTVHVKKSDHVKKGDPLLTFDTTTTQRSLEDEKTRYEQLQIQYLQMQEALKPLLRQGDDEDAIEKQKQDLQVKQLDMEIERRQIADLEKQIRDGEVLRAPFDGIVSSLSVEAGANVSPGQSVCTVASDASGYQLVFSASGDAADALQLGGNVKVAIAATDMPQTEGKDLPAFNGPGGRVLDGKISAIESGSGQSGGEGGSDAKTVTVDVSGDGLSPGLKATANIPQQSASPGFKIPVDALHSDDSGSYVFVATAKEGPLGSSYYAVKAYVNTGEQSDDTVVILSGLSPDERVVTDSSEPLSDGDRIRLE